jgi:DNA-binding SARP family transcriptional activator
MRVKINFYRCINIFRFIQLFIFLIISDVAFSQTYGLKFQSHEEVLDKRTELNLSPDQFLIFRDEFEIYFDYKIDLLNLNDYSRLFGYIFRIISQDNKNVDLIISPTPDIFLNMVIGKTNSIVQVGSPNINDTWSSLRVKFSLNQDQLIFYTPDTFFVQDNIGFKNDDSFKIIFGASNFENFKTSDVPSISIRDIRIFENGRLKYHWPLDEEEGNIAKNRFSKKTALVKNPKWLKNNHQKWEAKYQNEMEGLLLVASDPDNGKLFLITRSQLFVYTAHENSIHPIKYENQPSSLDLEYKAVYNNLDQKIYCYSLDNHLMYNLDIATGIWEENDLFIQTPTKVRHHNSHFNPNDNSLYIFGGYGQHKYNNEIRKIDLKKNEFQVLPSDDDIFTPRYLAGLGSLNDTLYILGGYGSLSGSQMVNPHSYFDLFGFCLKNKSLFKKFEIPRLFDDMCVVNNFWIDNRTRNYYALVFEKNKFKGSLQLVKGNIDNPRVEFVGNSIPFNFQDIKSYSGLFYFSLQNKLFAYTSFVKDSLSTQIDIYSIGYPPNTSDDNPFLVMKTRNNFPFIFIAIVIIIISAGLLFYVFRVKYLQTRSSRDNISINDLHKEKVDGNRVFGLEKDKTIYQLVLFGGFQVYNSNNEDITNKFSPLLKELFLLILLHTHKNNKGISSEKISEYLWFDKSEESARNNRAVNFAKLKAILADIGDFELTKKTGYWKVIYDNNNSKCDYDEFMQIIHNKVNLTKEDVIRIVEITQKGPFLLNVNYEWLDHFKSDVSDKVVDALVTFAEKRDLKTDAKFIVRLADCIFNFDPVNEEAMILKCRAEHCLGKHSMAKTTYEKFINEYKLLYDEEYKKTFHQLMKY